MKIKSIEITNIDEPSLDIEVADVHHYTLPNGVLVHNSSLVSNSTNSCYPVRQEIVIKTGANSKNVFMAPESEKYYYQSAWDLSCREMSDVYAVIQKFVGQSISADYYIDHADPENRSAKKLLTDWLYKNSRGVKTRYYTNNRTHSGSVPKGCGAGGCTL